MKNAVLIGIAALALIVVAGVGATASPKPSDYTMEQAQHLAATGWAFSEGKTVEVSVAEAKAAGQRPGFAAESQPSTPLDVCWTNNGMWFEWGTWPYQQRVNESRYWCATRYGGAQTYRTSHVTLGGGGGTLCNAHDAYGFRTTGGNGYTWTTFRSGGYFDCPTPIPYVTTHWNRWMEQACNTWGNCSLYDHSCTNCFLPGDGGGPIVSRP